MSEYVETLLAPGEPIITNARQHWAALVRFALTPILILAVGVSGLVVGAWLGTWASFQRVAGLLDWAIGLLTLLAFLVAVVWLPIQFVRWRTRRSVLTSRRVIMSVGLMRRTSIDASLDKITDIGYSQTFIGARLGYGDLVIATASNTPLEMRELLDANGFKKAIMVAQEDMVKERASALMGRPGGLTPAVAEALGGPIPTTMVATPEPVPAPRPQIADTPEEITATLARLTDMRADGTITDADFEAKKKELLDRL